MKNYIITVLTILISQTCFSQNRLGLTHEVGVNLGIVSFQSDYGVRKNFPSSYGNMGFGAGLNYFLSFNNKKQYWNDRGNWIENHFRIKLELSYAKVNFENRADLNGGSAQQVALIKGITGSTKLLNFGGQIEVNIFNMMDYRNLEPYLSIGGFYSTYTPEMESAFGDISNTSVRPTAYLNGIFLEEKNVPSFSFGLGARYHLNDNTKMIFDFRWQRFLSDKVDGLVPQLSANKYRDWLIYPNVGLAFDLN